MPSGSIVRRELSATLSVKFAPIWGMFFFILIVVIVLFFLFPKEELLKAIYNQHQADKVVKQYLINLTDLYPQNENFKLLLAEQHLNFDDLDKAFDVIQPYFKEKSVDKATHMKALWLYYRILQVTIFALPPASDSRRVGENRLKTLIKQLVDVDLPAEQLLQLGNDAIQLGMDQDALQLYNRAIEKPISNDPEASTLYAKAGQLVMGYSQYTLSAQLYFLAQKIAPNEKMAATYYIEALKSLVSGNLLDQAIKESQANLNGLSDNQDVLLYLVSLARSANNTELAQQYMLKILKLTYQDDNTSTT